MTTRQEVVQYIIGKCELLEKGNIKDFQKMEERVRDDIDYTPVARSLINGEAVMLKKEEFKGHEIPLLYFVWGLNKSKKTRALRDFRDAEIIADLDAFMDTLVSEYNVDESIREKQIYEISSLEEVFK